MIEQWAPGKRTRKRKQAEPPTEAQRARSRRYALAICRGAATGEARRLADELAQRLTGCNCTQLISKQHRTDERR